MMQQIFISWQSGNEETTDKFYSIYLFNTKNMNVKDKNDKKKNNV